MTFCAPAPGKRVSLAVIGSLIAIACSAQGSTADEIDEPSFGDAGGSASTTKDSGKDTASARDVASDVSAVDATSDAKQDAAKQDASVDSGSDAAVDSGAKDADASKVDSSATGVDCPVDAIYIAKGFAALLATSPTMCLNSACPKKQCCVQLYGVCVAE